MLGELITRATLEDLAGATALRRGEEYFSVGAVGRLHATDDRVTAKVEGTEIYQVELRHANDGELGYDCTCPRAADGYFCKHCVAVGLAWLAEQAGKGEPSIKSRKKERRDPWREIVGVVGDEYDDGLNRPATAIVYWPMLNESYRWRTMAYAVRSTRVGTPGFLRELEQAVWSVNPNLPLAAVQTLDEIQARSMAQTSFALVMLAIAASVALLIGVVGIYGVIAYAATQRTREIGVRMALGAQTGDVRKMFLRHGLRLTAAGIAIGIGVALVVTRVMSALLFGVGPMDPMTYVAVSAALAAVALLATYLPARRASRVDPIVALRADV